MEQCATHSRSSWGHDLLLMAFAAGATCAAIATYNCYVDRRLEENGKEIKDGKKGGVRGGLAQGVPEDARELVTSLATSLAHVDGVEASGNMLSAILAQLWSHMSVAIASTVKEIVEPILMDSLPVKVQFTKLDLGKVPIKATNMFIHRVDLENKMVGYEGKHAGIQMDFDIDWDGDCDIMLRAHLKPLNVSFGVKNFKLSGRMYLILSPLTSAMPVASAAQFGFINPPKLDLSFTGMASVLSSLDIIQKKIPPLIQSILNSVMVLPERMVSPIDPKNYDYLETYQPPVGMVRIAPLSGRGFQVQKGLLLKDIPDVYCVISLGASKPFKTSTKNDTLSPSWTAESCDFILYDMDQLVFLKVCDEDSAVEIDDVLGYAEITARELFRSGGKMEVELEKDKMNHGIFVTLSAEMFNLSTRLESFSSSEYGEKDQLCGLATIAVMKAFDIPLPKEDAATSIKCMYGAGSENEQTFYTGVVADAVGINALNPSYDSVFHVPLTRSMMEQASDNSVAFALVDGPGSNGSDAHGELGKIVVSHECLRSARDHAVIATSPIGDGGARLEYAIRLNGMQAGEEPARQASVDHARAPQAASHGGSNAGGGAMIRVTAVKGRGFKVKKRVVGKDDIPDVYCKVYMNASIGRKSTTSWKTCTIKNDTMPQWNESKVFVDVNPVGAIIRVDAYEDNRMKDDYLGRAEFAVGALLRKRTMELEICDGSTPTKTYVTFTCVELGSGKGGTSKVDKVPRIVDEGEKASSPQLEESWVHAVAENEKAPTALSVGQGLSSTLIEEPRTTPPKEPHSGEAGRASPAAGALPDTGAPLLLRVTALRGRGFPVKKHRIGKDDVPDVYCKVRLHPSRGGEPTGKWKTSVIKNSTTPEWNEARDFGDVNPSKALVVVDAYEYNTIKDDYLGHAEFPVGELLEKGAWEMELAGKKGSTGMYITFRCDPV